MDEQGTATYSIPLQVPPGTAGMQPELSLSYSGRSGNGLLGVGWSLGGLSTIHRCAATIAQDSFTDGVDLERDRFCLDGQRLIAVAGEYGLDGAEYRTEIDSQVKVVSYGQAGGGPAWFRVWTKSGQIMDYGNSADSVVAVDPTGDVLTWSVSRISDTVGNYFSFTYHNDASSGEHHPLRIDYTGNDPAGVPPYAQVLFDYEVRSDTTFGYALGYRREQNVRLASVQMRVDGVLAREYRLSYEQSAITGRSRIRSVRECGMEGGCLPALEFTWQEGQKGFIEEPAWGIDDPDFNFSYKENPDVGFRALDLNGDGLIDFLRARAKGDERSHAAFINTGNGFTRDDTWSLAAYPSAHFVRDDGYKDAGMQIVDLNSDGLPDLLRAYDSSSWDYHMAFLNTGEGFVEDASWKIPDAKAEFVWDTDDAGTRIVDLNGDGRPDLVTGFKWSDTGEKYRSYVNTGSGFVRQDDWTVPYQQDAQFADSSHTDEGARLVDLNGDQLPDILKLRRWDGGSTRLGFLNTGEHFERNDGWLPADAGFSFSYKSDWDGAESVDLNGDGLADLLQIQVLETGVRVSRAYINTGTGYVEDAGWHIADEQIKFQHKTKDRGLRLADLNGDGLADLLAAYRDGTLVVRAAYINTGRGFVRDDDWNFPGTITYDNQSDDVFAVKDAGYPRGLQILDINGDGLADLLRAHSYEYGSRHTAFINRGPVPDLLLGVRDALGAETALTYSSLTDKGIYTKGAGAVFPQQDFQAPLPVVSAVESSDGAGGTYRLEYRYAGARVHLQGRGFLGFERVESTDSRTGHQTITGYRQDFPYAGLAGWTEQRLADGTLVQRVESTYDALPSANGAVRFPYAATTVERSYELTGALTTQVTTQSAYDGFGNPTQVVVTTEGGGEVFVKETVNTYDNDPALWHLGRLRRAVVTHRGTDGDVQVRTSAFEYAPVTGLLTREVIEPDSPTAWQATDYEYDAFGNKVRATLSGPDLESRVTTTGYDARGRFATTTANALGHSETRVHHPAFGGVQSLTGPNGLTTTWTYDEFGRQVLEQRADGTVTEKQFEWCDAAAGCMAGAVYRVTTLNTGNAPNTLYYDILGREIRKEGRGFDGTPVYQDTVYNAIGQVARASLPYAVGEAAHWVETAYDALGRETAITQPGPGGSASVTETHYAGLSTTVVDPLGRQKTTTRNALGKVVHVQEEEGAWLTHGYDAAGNLVRTDAGGVVTTMAYDIRGRKVAMDDPDMGHWEYRYNAVGELVWQRDAKGQEVSIVYDRLGRMVQRDEPEGATTWTYDTAAGGVGKLAEVSGPGGYRETYGYDALGRPALTTTYAEGESFSVLTGYDAAGRVARVTRPQGFVVENVYNELGYLEAVRSPSGQVTDYDYAHLAEIIASLDDAIADLLAQATYYNGLAEDYRQQAAAYQALAADLEQQSDADLETAQLLREAAAQLIAHAEILEASAADKQAQADQLYAEADALIEIAELSDPYFRSYYLNEAALKQAEADDLLLQAEAELQQAADERAQAADDIAQAEALEQAASDAQATMALHLAEADRLLDLAEAAALEAERTSTLAANLQEVATHYAAMQADGDNIYYWRAKDRDAAGRLTAEIAGNGLVTDRIYDSGTGQLQAIMSGFGTAQAIRYLEYDYDALNNVTARHDRVQDLSETFAYDRLDRLTQSTVSGSFGDIPYNHAVDYQYDALGNITHKSDVGDYTYGAGNTAPGQIGPHALVSAGSDPDGYQYDANGNMTSGGGRVIGWTSFDKPMAFQRGDYQTLFAYGPDRSRYLKVSNTSRTLYVGKLYERELFADGQVKHKHFIYAGGELVAIQVKAEEDGAPLPDETRYLHRDNLGSIDTITDGRGNIVERLSYTPFGARRAGDWRATDPFNPAGLMLASFTNRGFTGHEHVEEMGLIHMNGRVYDPVLGRFLSADPNVQFPHASQSYNRYSYVLNNPLKYTDPSGYFLKKLWKSVKKFVKEYWRPIVAIALAIVTYGAMSAWLGNMMVMGPMSCAPMFTAAQIGIMSGAAAGFVSGVVLGGSLEAGVKGAITGGIMGGLNAALANADFGLRMLSRGAVSSAIAHVRGGDWKRAFLFSMAVDVARTGWQYTMRHTDRLYAAACVQSGSCRSDELGYPSDGGRVIQPGISESEWSKVPRFLQRFLRAGMAEEGSGSHLYDPGQPTCEFLGHAVCGAVRGFVRQVSKPHDWGNSWSYNRDSSSGYYGFRIEGGGYADLSSRVAYETAIQAWSFATMPVMAGFTGFALYGDYVNPELLERR
ncbi:RHS repeat-associated core domain-containing protein [Thioalbus denitrificans]|uniref:RHS repeat-associated protein n=1 Tax=Thioalbus denitrificans TaxID=547122 RepID=A0A369CEK1_9GAMM|nr:RHS repeat-associated core domain-containing protein [Thioalbus denitrificans]RCX31658.1 RHS repeat-associated protein [Thioalbus denitrificans]